MTGATWRRELSCWALTGGREVALHDVVDSTHRLGCARLEPGAPPIAPMWILAFEQRRGEGRRGRSWSSPPGLGVYATHVLTVPKAAVELLPMALGVGLCEGLAGLGFDGRLEWPNDLLLAGDKVGGILLRSRVAGAAAGVVASFGVNVGHRRRHLPRADATSLTLAAASGRGGRSASAAGSGLELPAVSIALVESVEARLASLVAEPGAAAPDLLARYRGLSVHRLGDTLTVDAGGRRVEGRFAGFAASGQLRLATGAGELVVGAGELAR